MDQTTDNTRQGQQQTETLRLIFPQGTGIMNESWIPQDRGADTLRRGYDIGASLLGMLMPGGSTASTVQIPLSEEASDPKSKLGMENYDNVLRQTKLTSDIVRSHDPARIVSLAGDFTASVVPIGYLARRYFKDMAVIWIDSSPDVSIPYTMALMAWLGKRLKEFNTMWPTMIPASKLLAVGYRAWNQGLNEWQENLGLKGVSPRNITADGSAQVKEWLRETGVGKVFIHLDLDVLDPGELMSASSRPVGDDGHRRGIRMQEVVQLINDVSTVYDLVGLTVVETIPRVALSLRTMLEQLPLFTDAKKDEA